MIYIDIQIKPFLKVKKYVEIISFQSLAPVKNQVLYSIMIIKFFTKAIAISYHCLFWKIPGWERVVKTIFYFSSSDTKLNAHMGPLDKSEWKAIVLGWSLRPLGLLLKKVCQQPSFKKNIYFNLSFMHFYNYINFVDSEHIFKKKWKSASLVSVFTTSKKYDRFFKAFSFGTRKKCISWHYFMQVVNVYFHGL